jgi:hypothetical protein
MERAGQHPELGVVTLRQLLATWIVHDLDHVGQIARVMAKVYWRRRRSVASVRFDYQRPASVIGIGGRGRTSHGPDAAHLGCSGFGRGRCAAPVMRSVTC